MSGLVSWLSRVPGFRALGRSTGRGIALALLALLLVGLARESGPHRWLRNRVFDTWQTLRPRVADAELRPAMIVAIDEESLRLHGQWPWPRDLLADVVRRIAAQEPAAIGIDVLFPEPDRLSPGRLAERLPELDPAVRQALVALPSFDAKFAEALAAAPTVLAVDGVRIAGATPVPAAADEAAGALPRFDHAVRSLPELSAAAGGAGAISIGTDVDGVVRRVPAAVRIGSETVASLPVEMLRIASGVPSPTFEKGRRGLEAVALGDLRIPTDRDGSIWIPFSPHEPWRMVPAADLLAGRVPADALTGRFVLVGATAEGTGDVVSTPLGKRMWGIEVHAQLLESVLGDGPLRRPGWTFPLEMLLALLFGAVVIALLPGSSPGKGGILVAVLAGLAGGGSFAVFAARGLLLDPVPPVLAAAFLAPMLFAFTIARLDFAKRDLEASLAAERDRAQRLLGEVEAARKIQMGILPRKFPAFPKRKDFDVHAMIVPARTVGGDLYDFFLLDENRLFFMIGDVSGKGVPASLFMAITKALYKRNALLGDASIGAIMTEANREIAGENSEMLFVTAFAGILDLTTGEVDYCNAGHDPPYRLHPGELPELLRIEGGPPLCAVDDFQFEGERTRLAPGESIVLFTDGVTEAMTKDGALYGLEQIGKALEGLDAAPAAVAEALYADVQRFVDGAEPSDDICILVIRRA